MGGHKSKSCTFSEPAVITPPPVPDLVVSGNGLPSPNGNYYEDGIYNGYMSYKHESADYYIWLINMVINYCISTSKGTLDDYGWVNSEVDVTPIGTYAPVTELGVGNPIVNLP
jgi:hypothetical protein